MEDGAESQQLLSDEAAAGVVTEEADADAQVEETSADLDPIAFGDSDSDGESFADSDPHSDFPAAGSAFESSAPSSVFGSSAASSAFDSSATVTAAGQDDDLDPVTYGENGSYVYEDSTSHSFGGDSYLGRSRVDGGYNFHMSVPAEETPSVPPYPAEMSAPSAAAASAAPSAGKLRAAKAVGAKIRGEQQPPARRANLVLDRLEPWSVMKFSFLISLVAWVVLFVAVAVLYYALSAAGVFTSIGKTLSLVSSSQGSSGIDITKWTSASRVLGYTMLIGAVDIILITGLCTIGAMVYNLVSHLGGGIEITLKEAD